MKVLFNLFVLVLCLGLSSCKEQEVRSTWRGSQVTIDGGIEEWKNDPFAVFEDEHLALGIKNDSEYLYLAARVGDAAIQRLARRTGVTLWLAPDGGNDQDLEIRIPPSGFGLPDETRRGFPGGISDEERERTRQRWEEIKDQIVVIDNRNVETRIFPANAQEGFAAGLRNSESSFTFELRIPIDLQNYFRGLERLGAEGKVGLGIKIGAPRMEAFRGMRADGGGGPQGPFGGRGRRGGVGGGAPRRGGVAEIKELDVWMSVVLAEAR